MGAAGARSWSGRGVRLPFVNVCAHACVCAQTIIARSDKEGELERQGPSGRSQCPGIIRRTESHSRRLAEHMTYDGEWEPFFTYRAWGLDDQSASF